MNTKIERVENNTQEVLDALNRLMPQMSSRFQPISKEDLDKVIKNKFIHLLVLRKGGNIIASATLAIVPTPSNVLGFVEDVVVDEEFRGKGYGRVIMQEIIIVSKKANVKQIKLQSNSTRVAANHMYQNLGFTKFDTNSYSYNID